MNVPRSSGILLHPTCLSSPFGIGDFGPEAYRFADQLIRAGQTVWQMLPLGPTAQGNSPYSSFSAFAGNPLLISPELLLANGLLGPSDLSGASAGMRPDAVDFAGARAWKAALLTAAFHRSRGFASTDFERELLAFRTAERGWLEDYALFMALRERFPVAHSWTEWDLPIVQRREPDLAYWRRELNEAIEREIFVQFVFAKQWRALQRHCRRAGLLLMGDTPIYVAHNSADVWARPDLFELDERGCPTVVAGVPPDYFSETGQLWGNPIYRWPMMANNGFAWWLDRFRHAFQSFDLLRLDHFRGFEAYWQVPAGEPNAIHGEWVKAPGAALFARVEQELGEVRIVAENLGVITPEVEQLRRQFGFPGMAVLQFAFGPGVTRSPFVPHNFEHEVFAYTGTHDNDTLRGWWDSLTPAVRRQAERYFPSLTREGNWAMVRGLAASVARVVITPMQDILGLGPESRMNTPAVADGNWSWRMLPDAFVDHAIEQLRELAETYERVPDPPLNA